MVQTVRSITILAGEKMIIIEKPHVSNRIFFSVQAFAPLNEWHRLNISFDDPLFRSYYALDGPARYFEGKGEGIFQGNIWGHNISSVNLLVSATEILI